MKRPRIEDIDGIPDDHESQPPKPKHSKHDHQHCSPPPLATRPSPQSEPALKKPKRRTDGSSSPAKRRRLSNDDSQWYRNNWLERDGIAVPTPCETEDVDVPTTHEIEAETSDFGAHKSDASTDSMSSRDGDSQEPGSSESGGEKNKTSTSTYRILQRMHGILHDEHGRKIPHEVRQFVDKHIRKARENSPPLDDEAVEVILESIDKVRNSCEPTAVGIMVPPLFPIQAPGLQAERDVVWSRLPVPSNADVPTLLARPKTDIHVGFETAMTSNWDFKMFVAAGNPLVSPYAQPTSENLFPSYLCEFKSEAAGGTTYAAENQLATAGAHRVNSFLKLLDKLDPRRTPSCTDALVFSHAVSPRQAIAFVHFFNPKDGKFYMSLIDNFYFAFDVQRFHSHGKNLRDWLLSIQKPQVEDLLTRLIPATVVMKKPKRARPAPASDASGPIGGGTAVQGDEDKQPKRTKVMGLA